jgi:hypothetical protein
MKFMPQSSTTEIVGNLAWIQKSRAMISLYSLRKQGKFGQTCDYDRALEIVRAINSAWDISHWCFDWTAEMDLELCDDSERSSIFAVLHKRLIKPMREIVGDSPISLLHGDADIAHRYENWLKIPGKRQQFYSVGHINRFIHHYYSTAYPDTPVTALPKRAYSTFNRKSTHYRSELYKYLENNKLLDQGYVNFAFEKSCNLIRSFADDYEEHSRASENLIRDCYAASNFDIVIETATAEYNQRFITEKTLRALALGQPFVVFSGPDSLRYLQGLGFKTYHDLWDERYDTMESSSERFANILKIVHQLIVDPSVFDVNHSKLNEINEHNRNHFRELAKINHRDRWFENKII